MEDAIVTRPVLRTDRAERDEPTRLACFFHLNLAFSSLEEECHGEVIERCYRPLLELPHHTGFSIGIEATGWTLERVSALAPDWTEKCSALIAAGEIEFIGSAWAQCAAPLLPAEVNEWNLRLGRAAYASALGVEPRIALVSEQAFSPGLVDLFESACYEAIIADWENACRSHPEWPKSHGRFPQRAVGTISTLPVIWSQSIAFQKLQRFAHGELTLDEYLEFVRGLALNGGALMLYGNDAEVFDYRPGRFAAEPTLDSHGEWRRIADAFSAIREQGLGAPALPLDFLALLDHPCAGHVVELTAPDQPVPVKKQDKYHHARWACTGRDDVGINTRCWRLYHALSSAGCDDPDEWRRLCWLWSSDFRTHITDRRWESFLHELAELERRWQVSDAAKVVDLRVPHDDPRDAVERDGNRYLLRAGDLEVCLNARRGLAIHSFADRQVSDAPLFGTLEHGYFETIDLGADFYSGHLVQEAPLRHKVTDLEPVEPALGRPADGGISAYGRLETELGEIEKLITLDPDERALGIEWVLHWEEIPAGSLRLGYVTLIPEAFETEELWFASHNGGRALERHALGGKPFDHGAPVSALVTCRQGLGLTEGVVMIGDGRRYVRVDVDQAATKLFGLVSFRPAAPGYPFRLAFSATETDDTRRGPILRHPEEPQRVRLRIACELSQNSAPDLVAEERRGARLPNGFA